MSTIPHWEAVARWSIVAVGGIARVVPRLTARVNFPTVVNPGKYYDGTLIIEISEKPGYMMDIYFQNLANREVMFKAWVMGGLLSTTVKPGQTVKVARLVGHQYGVKKLRFAINFPTVGTYHERFIVRLYY